MERLDTTTLPFAKDAAQIIGLVPPQPGCEYLVLDDACGTGAAVEWIITEFNEVAIPLNIVATDYSAIMINEVERRARRQEWGANVKWVVMDAQVQISVKVTNSGFMFPSQYIYACLYDIWHNVDP